MTDRAHNGWLICDKGVCLYAEEPHVRLRCIKHGSLLNFDWRLTGKTRAQARQYLASKERNHERQ